MKFKPLHIILILIGFAIKTNAQELLKLEDAVKIALENNYEIKLAKNDLKIDETNNYIGNAGMLPSINANITDNNTVLDTKQTQGDGTERELNNAKNMNLSYGVSLDWTVFDGLRMFARKEQLNILQKQGEAELKLAILTKIGDVYLSYFD
ncbi:MAG TPA: TolC family protein, partial [Flavobacterium sp.]|nr:TolC family protein [Flavobacterium sp.]